MTSSGAREILEGCKLSGMNAFVSYICEFLLIAQADELGREPWRTFEGIGASFCACMLLHVDRRRLVYDIPFIPNA